MFQESVLYNGKQLIDKWNKKSGIYQLSIITLKNGVRDRKLTYPPSSLKKDKIYECCEHSRTTGSGVEYNTISILNYDNE